VTRQLKAKAIAVKTGTLVPRNQHLAQSHEGGPFRRRLLQREATETPERSTITQSFSELHI
jgi:hypothetical protein